MRFKERNALGNLSEDEVRAYLKNLASDPNVLRIEVGYTISPYYRKNGMKFKEVCNQPEGYSL